MLNAYVGIADGRGLQCLIPEDDGSLPLLLGQAFAKPAGRPLCFWAVLDAELARGIAAQMAAGNRTDALRSLQACAREMGSIVPPHGIVTRGAAADAPGL